VLTLMLGLLSGTRARAAAGLVVTIR